MYLLRLDRTGRQERGPVLLVPGSIHSYCTCNVGMCTWTHWYIILWVGSAYLDPLVLYSWDWRVPLPGPSGNYTISRGRYPVPDGIVPTGKRRDVNPDQSDYRIGTGSGFLYPYLLVTVTGLGLLGTSIWTDLLVHCGICTWTYWDRIVLRLSGTLPVPAWDLYWPGTDGGFVTLYLLGHWTGNHGYVAPVPGLIIYGPGMARDV